MERHGHSLIHFFLFALWLLATASAQSDSGSTERGTCSAEQKYLEYQSKLQQSDYASKRDYSCLTDLTSISDNLSAYQLVDTRQNIGPASIVPNAWRMSVSELRNTKNTRNKQLLLLNDGFSRVKAAEDCALLKKSGYSDVKILVGGAEAWAAQNSQRYINTYSGARLVSAKDMIYEYFNGNIIIVTSSSSVANNLDNLGFSDVHTISYENRRSGIVQLIADRSGGGYYPIVMVGGTYTARESLPNNVNNLYVLDGEVSELVSEIDKNQWINVKRNSVPRRYLCERS